MQRLKKDDTVKVRTGRDRGKEGKIREILTAEGKAIVAEVNVYKKHVRAGQNVRGNQARQAGIIDIEAPLRLSNLTLVCASCGKPTKVANRTLPTGEKVRVCKLCGEET
jgi:large subunit ribosomal protein L24